MAVGSLDSGAGLHIIGRAQNHHAGDCPHQGEVFAALVGSAVLADRKPAVGGGDLDIEVRVADGVAHLLPSAAGREHGKA